MNEQIHQAACVIAKRFVHMIAGILRDDERHDAEIEGYRIAREVMEELAAFNLTSGNGDQS